jgi:lipoate-protein ligase A
MSLVVQGQPYLNFINSLKSKETKGAYSRALLRFTAHYQGSLQQLVSLTHKDIQQMVTTYITNMNARGLSHGYVNLDMSAIFHFFDMNDIVLNKRKISKFVGEHKKMNKDRGYEHKEIKLLADVGDFRFKALIYLLRQVYVWVP